MTYEFQMISSGFTDILHDVAIIHPFEDHGELHILEGVRNADKVEDIRMRQVFPHGNDLTEVLCGV